ncbi:hypothetical protein Vafri_1628, partial [Volvox africanus]
VNGNTDHAQTHAAAVALTDPPAAYQEGLHAPEVVVSPELAKAASGEAPSPRALGVEDGTEQSALSLNSGNHAHFPLPTDVMHQVALNPEKDASAAVSVADGVQQPSVAAPLEPETNAAEPMQVAVRAGEVKDGGPAAAGLVSTMEVREAQLVQLQAEVERLRSEVAEVGASKAELAAHVAALSSARQALEAEVQLLRAQLEERTHAQAVEARVAESDMAQARQAQATLAAEVEELRELQRKTKEELAHWEVLHRELRTQLESKDRELSTAQAAVEELQQLRQQLGGEDASSLVARAQQASVLEAKYEKLKEEGKVRFDKLKEQSNNRKVELAEARHQLVALAEEKAALEARLQTATTSADDTAVHLQRQLSDANAERDQLRVVADRVPELEARASELQAALASVQDALAAAHQAVHVEAERRAAAEAALEAAEARRNEVTAAASRQAEAAALAERRVAQLEAELESARLATAEVECRVAQLEPVEAECAALRENIAALETKAAAQAGELAAEVQRLTEVCESQQRELADGTVGASLLQKQLTELRAELEERLDATAASAAAAAEAVAQERHEVALAAVKARLADLEEELSKERAQLAKGKAAFKKAKEENQRLKEELAKVREDLSAATMASAAASGAAVAAAEEQVALSAAASEQFRQEASKWEEKAGALASEVAKVRSESEVMRQRLEAAEASAAELRVQVESLTSDNEQLQQQYSEQLDAQDQMEAKLIQQAAELNALRIRLQEGTDKLAALEAESAAAAASAQQAAEAAAAAQSMAEENIVQLEQRATEAEALAEVRASELANMQAAAEQARSKVAELERALMEAEAQAAELRAAATRAQEAEMERRQKASEVSAALEAAYQQVAKAQHSEQEAAKELAQLRIEVEEVRAEASFHLKQQAIDMETMMEARGLELTTTQALLEEARSKVEGTQQELEKAEGHSAKLQAIVDAQEATIEALRGEIAQAITQADESRQQLEELQRSSQAAALDAAAEVQDLLRQLHEVRAGSAAAAAATSVVRAGQAEAVASHEETERLEAALAEGGSWDANEFDNQSGAYINESGGFMAADANASGEGCSAPKVVLEESQSTQATAIGEIQSLRDALQDSQDRISELEGRVLSLQAELEEAQSAAMDAADAADRCELLQDACKTLRTQLEEAVLERKLATERASEEVKELQERQGQLAAEHAVAMAQAELVAKLQVEVAQLREDLEAAVAREAEAVMAMQTLRQHVDQEHMANREASSVLQRRCEQLHAELDESSHARAQLEAEAKALRAQLDELCNGNEHLITELREARAALNSEQVKLTAAVQRVGELEQQLSAAAQEHEKGVATAVAAVMADRAGVNVETEASTAQLAALEQLRAELETELSRLRNVNEELEGRCLGLEALSQQRQEQLQQQTQQLHHLQEYTQNLQTQLADASIASRSLAEAQGTLGQLRRQLEEAVMQAAAASQRAQQLETALQEQRARAGGLEQQLAVSHGQVQQLQQQLNHAASSRAASCPAPQEVEARVEAHGQLQQQNNGAPVERLRNAATAAAPGGEGASGAAAVAELRQQVMELQSERAVLLSRATQVDSLQVEVDALRHARVQLEMALRAEQRRNQAAGGMVLPPGLGGPDGVGASSPERTAGAAADKKRDDMASQLSRMYDPENAVLQGASTTFQPISGLLRGNCPPFASSTLGAAARLHDKVTVALYCRPTARLLFSTYVLLLHVLVLI